MNQWAGLSWLIYEDFLAYFMLWSRTFSLFPYFHSGIVTRMWKASGNRVLYWCAFSRYEDLKDHLRTPSFFWKLILTLFIYFIKFYYFLCLKNTSSLHVNRGQYFLKKKKSLVLQFFSGFKDNSNILSLFVPAVPNVFCWPFCAGHSFPHVTLRSVLCMSSFLHSFLFFFSAI